MFHLNRIKMLTPAVFCPGFVPRLFLPQYTWWRVYWGAISACRWVCAACSPRAVARGDKAPHQGPSLITRAAASDSVWVSPVTLYLGTTTPTAAAGNYRGPVGPRLPPHSPILLGGLKREAHLFVSPRHRPPPCGEGQQAGGAFVR